LKPGDIVLAVDGDKIKDSGDLVAKLHTYKPGDTVQMTVLSNGNQSQVPVTLQVLKEQAANPAEKPGDEGAAPGAPAQSDKLGFTAEDQTPDIQSQLPAGAPKGPVITQIDPQSPAAAGGLQQGDVVLKAGNMAIVTAKQLSAVLKKSDLKNGIRLFIWRNGVTLYAFLQTGDE